MIPKNDRLKFVITIFLSLLSKGSSPNFAPNTKWS